MGRVVEPTTKHIRGDLRAVSICAEWLIPRRHLRTSPRLEESFMPIQALQHVTVLECATFVTGPYAAALLADLGARVIKIESPPGGDPYRYFAPDSVFSFNFAHLNRNKESLVLDLKAPQGKEIFFELLKKADVFVENFRPGTADR